MIRAVHRISTLLVLAIGIVHTAGTFVFYRSLSEAAIWFAGAGLGGVFVALLNMALWSPDVSPMSRRSAAAANFLFFFWLVAGVSATPEPMQEVVALVGAAMVISAALPGRRKVS
jgi:hypothetical protein